MTRTDCLGVAPAKAVRRFAVLWSIRWRGCLSWRSPTQKRQLQQKRDAYEYGANDQGAPAGKNQQCSSYDQQRALEPSQGPKSVTDRSGRDTECAGESRRNTHDY